MCQEKTRPVQISLPFQKRKVSENTLHKNRSSLERKNAGKMHQNWWKCRRQEKILPEIVQFLTDLKSGKILIKSTKKKYCLKLRNSWRISGSAFCSFGHICHCCHDRLWSSKLLNTILQIPSCPVRNPPEIGSLTEIVQIVNEPWKKQLSSSVCSRICVKNCPVEAALRLSCVRMIMPAVTMLRNVARPHLVVQIKKFADLRFCRTKFFCHYVNFFQSKVWQSLYLLGPEKLFLPKYKSFLIFPNRPKRKGVCVNV